MPYKWYGDEIVWVVGLITMCSSRVYYSAPCCQLSYLPENISLDSPITHYNSRTDKCVDVLTQHTTLDDINSGDDKECDNLRPLDEVVTPKNSANDLMIKQEKGEDVKIPKSPISLIVISSDSNKPIRFKDFVIKPKIINNELINTDNNINEQKNNNDELTRVVSNTYLVNNRSTIYRMRVPLAKRILATTPSDDLNVQSIASTDYSDKDDNIFSNEKRKLSITMDNKSTRVIKKTNTLDDKLNTKSTSCSIGVNKVVKSSGFRNRPPMINFNKIHRQMQMFVP